MHRKRSTRRLGFIVVTATDHSPLEHLSTQSQTVHIHDAHKLARLAVAQPPPPPPRRTIVLPPSLKSRTHLGPSIMPPTTSSKRPHNRSSAAGMKGANRQPTATSSSSGLTQEDYSATDTSDDNDDDDDDDDAEAALQMDGQDLWNQNFCSVCDCLIPPGTGVGALSRSSMDSPVSPTTATIPMSKSSSASSGLRSTTGTIKARPTSSDGPKRSSSATKLDGHAVGARRQGSSSSRLNALSDLKPTTRITGGDGSKTANGSKASRRTSNTSVKSTSTSSSGLVDEAEAHSGSGASTATTTALQRSRKGGLLGGLTPAALKQQEQEELQAKAPAALYCSERCRAIDEQTSPTGLAELSLYSSQPPDIISTNAWASGSNWSPEAPFQRRIWPRTASAASIPLAYSTGTGVGAPTSIPNTQTPDSEYAPCMCAECMEKHSAGGAVPSGASDTTESSSSGYVYGSRGGPGGNVGYYRTQRSRSGRIVTPQNIHPPHGGEDGYFPDTNNTVASGLDASSSTSSRRAQPSGANAAGAVPERTASAASARSGTDSSTQSIDSLTSMWEPVLKPRRTSQPHQPGLERGSTARASGIQRGLDALPPSLLNSERSSRHFEDEETTVDGQATATGQRRGSASVHVAQSSRRRSSSSTPSGSVPATASPLRLLRGSSHRGDTPYDVSAPTSSQSPSAGLRGPLSTSVTSDHTLGTSAQTLVNREHSLHERRYGKGKSLASNNAASSEASERNRSSSLFAEGGSSSHGHEHSSRGFTSSRLDQDAARGLSTSYTKPDGSSTSSSSRKPDAMEALRAASRRDSSGFAAADPSRRFSSGSAILSGASSAWLKGLSSALTSLRGQPSAAPAIVVPDGDDPATNRDSPVRTSSAVSHGRSTSSVSPSGRSATTRSSDNTSTSTSNLSRSAASESLSRMLANPSFDTTQTRSASPASVARPDANRGSVPAFANEIGRGQIPGEAASSVTSGRAETSDSHREKTPALSTSATSQHRGTYDEAEERRRRRAEHRHQRSRDVTVLPPLLAPSNRSGTPLSAQNRANSYVNLAQQRNRSRSRSSTSGGGAAFVVGSYSSSYTPSRPITPGLASPGLRAPRAAEPDNASRANALQRATSQQDVAVVGRRPPLGWSGSGMTPIAPSPVDATHPRSIGNGHAAQASHYLQEHPHSQQQQHAHHSTHHSHPHHAHHHHHHHHHHQQQSHRPAHLRHGHHVSASHAHSTGHGHGPPSASLNARGGLALGHVGLLGHHPHGAQPAYGRHNTMPVRSSTPIVPEDGGEMSGAALTGANAYAGHAYHPHGVERPRSAVGHRRNSQLSTHSHSSSTALHAPSRPGSSMGLRPISASPNHATQSQPRWSYDNLANAERDAKAGRVGGGVRTYPLLQLPGREETHDRYDDAWSNAVELIAGPEGVRMAEEEKARRRSLKHGTSSDGGGPGADSAYGLGTARRKQLFHFGA